MEVVVGRVTEERTGKILEILGKQMPLNHLADVEIGRMLLVEKTSDICSGHIGFVLRAEAYIDDFEARVFLNRGDDIPLTSSITLCQDSDPIFLNETEQILSVRKRASFKERTSLGLLTIDPQRSRFEEPRLIPCKRLECSDRFTTSSDKPASGMRFPNPFIPIQGCGCVIAFREKGGSFNPTETPQGTHSSKSAGSRFDSNICDPVGVRADAPT